MSRPSAARPSADSNDDGSKARVAEDEETAVTVAEAELVAEADASNG